MKKIITLLKKIKDKDIKILSSDCGIKQLNKTQITIWLEVATMLLGKDKFTEKEIIPKLKEAETWFCLEHLRRLKLLKINNNGDVIQTTLGKDVAEFVKENEKNKHNN